MTTVPFEQGLLRPQDEQGNLARGRYDGPYDGLEPSAGATIVQVTQSDQMREGAGMLAYFDILIPETDPQQPFWREVNIKPHWLRTNVQHHTPGVPDYDRKDVAAFGGTSIDNNRVVWVPEGRRLDRPIPPSAPGDVNREKRDVVLQHVLPSPVSLPGGVTFPGVEGTFQGVDSWVERWVCLGRALAFTAEAVPSGQPAPEQFPIVLFSYVLLREGGTPSQGVLPFGGQQIA